ncbi:hypothetical protein WM40_24215 [Robbsia andropogonis]|uniref:Uncharacterized protein n=1 Tax=Robbsia andropogonis TaxID=28092 RepID=A0A0F5JUF8_9BURK|nr:hypothetical protein WM40_24215 [Robbsia andropogonis]
MSWISDKTVYDISGEKYRLTLLIGYFIVTVGREIAGAFIVVRWNTRGTDGALRVTCMHSCRGRGVAARLIASIHMRPGRLQEKDTARGDQMHCLPRKS